MVAGRFPSWNLAEGFEGAPWREAAQVTSKGRLVVPNTVRRKSGWLSPSALDLLASMQRRRRAKLSPWVPEGERVLEELRQTLADAPQEKEKALLAAQSRYARLHMDKDGRVVLAPNLLAHLAVAEGDWLYVEWTQDGVALANVDATLEEEDEATAEEL